MKENVSLSSSLESSYPHQYVCALFIPPQQQRQQDEREQTGSLNKTELDGALWSHIPFILDLIFVEHRQQTLQRQGTFLQASSDLRLGCPHCTHHTHPHIFIHTLTHTHSENTPSIPYFLCWTEKIRMMILSLCLCLLIHANISKNFCNCLSVNSNHCLCATVHLQTLNVLVTDSVICYQHIWF